jgi:hypothetical protein
MPQIFRGEQFERDLKNLANRNPYFKDGDADKVTFSTKIEFQPGTDLYPFSAIEDKSHAEFIINSLDCSAELLYELSAERRREDTGRYYVYLLGITYEQVINSLPPTVLNHVKPKRIEKIKKHNFTDLTLLANTTFIITTHPDQPSSYIDTIAYKYKGRTIYLADSDKFTTYGAEGVYIRVHESEQDTQSYVFLPDDMEVDALPFPDSVDVSLQIHNRDRDIPFHTPNHVATQAKLALQAMKEAIGVT